MAAGRSKNVRFENNVVIRPLIRAICLSGCEDVHIAGNIITDNLRTKRSVWLLTGGAFNAHVANNCFFLRTAESERPIFGHDGGRLAEYEKKVGLEGANLTANPRFSVAKGDEELAKEQYFTEVLLHRIRDFPDLFATNPEVVERGIGLQPDAFKDFQR
jgi:hypothetical protein